MRYKSTIKANIDPLVFESIKYELEDMGRSIVTLKKTKDAIEFIVKSDDSVSLRASLNGITKLLTAYEGIENVK